jgi:hypothetical protein
MPRANRALFPNGELPPNPSCATVKVHHVATLARTKIDRAPGETAMISKRDYEIAIKV